MLCPTDFSYSHQECNVFQLILNVHSKAGRGGVCIISIIIIICKDFYICIYLFIPSVTKLYSFSKA